MAISTALSRFSAYYTRHGFGSTARRAGLAARRALFSNRMVIFYCDISGETLPPADLPNFLKVEPEEERCRTQPAGLKRDYQ